LKVTLSNDTLAFYKTHLTVNVKMFNKVPENRPLLVIKLENDWRT